MPLPIASSENLNIPPSHFNGDGLYADEMTLDAVMSYSS